MVFGNPLRAFQQRIDEGQSQSLGFGTVDDAPGKAAVLLRKLCVQAFPQRHGGRRHGHGSASLSKTHQSPKFALQWGQLCIWHPCGQRHQLGTAGTNPEEAIAEAVHGLHLAQAHGQLLHGDMGQNADVRRPHGHGVVLGERRVVAGIPEAAYAH